VKPKDDLKKELGALRTKVGELSASGKFGEALQAVDAFAEAHADAKTDLREETLTAAEARYADLAALADAALAEKDYAKARAALAPAPSFGIPALADRAKAKLAEIDSRDKQAEQWAAWEVIKAQAAKLVGEGKYDGALAALAKAKALPLDDVAALIAEETDAVEAARTKALAAVADAYAAQSDAVWTLFKARKYADADVQLAALAAKPEAKAAAIAYQTDLEAAKALKAFWKRVEAWVAGRKGKFVSIAGVSGNVTNVTDGVVTLQLRGATFKRRVDQLAVRPALAYAGLKGDEASNLLKGVFLLAEGVQIPDAKAALAAAGDSPHAAAWRERLGRLGQIARESEAQKAWQTVQRTTAGKLTEKRAKEVRAALAKFTETYGDTRAAAALQGDLTALNERIAEALRVAYALEFDGKNSIEVPFDDAHRLNGIFTIEAKFWLPPLGERGGVLISRSCSRGKVGGTFRVTIANSGTVKLSIHRRAPFSWHSTTSTAALPAGRWHHLACQYDGASLLLYANGEKLAAERIDKQLNCDKWPLRIGGDTYYSDRGFHGRISDVRYWDRSLTLDEIRANATRPLKGGEKGLVGCWDFTEGVGGALHDLSPHAKHATIRVPHWITRDGKPTGRRYTDLSGAPTARTECIGGGGKPTFEDIPEGGGLLVGLKITTGAYVAATVITSVQPLYVTPAGKQAGAVYGTPGKNSQTVMAKPGYAVGGVVGRLGDRLDGFTVVFSKRTAKGLDPRDSYTSSWIGGAKKEILRPGCTGEPVVGLYGRLWGKDLVSLGLVVSSGMPAAPAGPAATLPTRTPKQVTVTVPGKAAWLDSGVDLTKGRRYAFTATGKWWHGTGAHSHFGPAGNKSRASDEFPIPGVQELVLLGRIGRQGKPFIIGERLRLDPEESGRLYMQMNDTDTSDNSGSLQVTIVSEGKAPVAPATAKPEPRTPAAAKPVKAGAWQSLFDGKSLTGWRVASGGSFKKAGLATVADGCLVLSGDGSAAGVARTDLLARVDYEVTFEAMRAKGRWKAGALVFPVGNSSCLWNIGNYGKSCGFDQVNGKDDNDKGNPTFGTFDLTNGQWYRFHLRVAGGRVQGSIDGKTVIDLPTPAHRFTLWHGFTPVAPLGFVTDADTIAKVRKVMFRVSEGKTASPKPAPPAASKPLKAGAWKNLFDGKTLRGWEVAKGADVSVKDAALTIGRGGPHMETRWTGECPTDNYEIEFETMRVDGGHDFGGIAFPVGAQGGQVSIGGYGDKIALSHLDGADGYRNGTAKPITVEDGRWYKVRVRVAGGRLGAWLDGEQVIDLDRQGRRLGVATGRPRARLTLYTYMTAGARRNIRLRRIEPDRTAVPKARSERKRAYIFEGKPLVIEAEHALTVTKPIQVAEDSCASGGAFVWEPCMGSAFAKGGGGAVFHIAVRKPAKLYFWWRLITPTTESDSINVGVSPGKLTKVPKMTTCHVGRRGKWGWVPYDPAAGRESRTRTPMRLSFERGLNTLVISSRESGAAVDAIALTAKPEPPDAAPAPRGTAVPTDRFNAAFTAGIDALAKGDSDPARSAYARAKSLRSTAAVDVLTEAHALAMKNAIVAAKTADRASLKALLAFAELAKPGDPDVTTLTEWAKTTPKPLFSDDFSGRSLARWKAETGKWSIDGGRLACQRGGGGVIFARTEPLKDFVLAFDMFNTVGEVGFRLGAAFRERPEGFITVIWSDEYNDMHCHGASGYDKGPIGSLAGVRGRTPQKHVPFETDQMYRVAIRCVGGAFECYRDGTLEAEGTDETPKAGRIGFVIQRANARYDNVRIYRPAPLPKLDFAQTR
ncbi:DUF1080 domain-containing protein, partial [bacterium]|nr:DUF1080 domain-containing protein [bacterium]